MSDPFNDYVAAVEEGLAKDAIIARFEAVSAECEHPHPSRFHFYQENTSGLAWWCLACGALQLGGRVRLVGMTMDAALTEVAEEERVNTTGSSN